MRPIRRILVAIKDPGARANPAVAKAAWLARACGAHLELFHSIKASVFADTSAAYEQAVLDLHDTQRQQYLQRLERIAARVRLHGVKVSTAVEYDYPAYDAIVRRACLIKADLIVSGSHGDRHTAAGLLRLTDWELLRLSPVPVLLVKRSRPYRHPNVLVAVDPCRAHSKPLQLDEEILGLGSAIADALHGKLHAIHAYAPVAIGSAAGSVSTSISVRLEGIGAADAKVQFERILEGTNISRARRHLVGGFPDAAISQVARRTQADIVVMGAMSRSGLKRLIIGNTAERLLDELPCDLLIVKPAQFASRVTGTCKGPRLVARAG
jgi:universal stress protein E